MKRRKKTKIVATLGPATSNEEIIREMILEGVDVFRINFSHAKYDIAKKNIQTIRKVSAELGSNTAVLADLQGPKLLIGMMKEEVVVRTGDEILFCTGKEFKGNRERVYMNYDGFPKDVKVGERVLLDDGKIGRASCRERV